VYKRQSNYFEQTEERKPSHRSRVLLTIPRLLELDMQLLTSDQQDTILGVRKLRNLEDLETLRTAAQDRKRWLEDVVTTIGNAAMEKWLNREQTRTRGRRLRSNNDENTE
jgi:hypothetical protein